MTIPSRVTRCKRFLTFAGALAAALLASGPPASAAHAVGISDINCKQASCEAVRTAQTLGVNVVGLASKQANSTVGLVIIDQTQKVIHQDRLTVGADGMFRVLVPARGLTPGQYKFGVFTLEKPSSVLAAGSFSVTAETVADEKAPRKGLGGFLDRLNSNLEKQPTDASGASTPAPGAATPAAPATRPAANSGGGFFFRTFGLAIPGVAYTTDNYATNTRTVTVSSGVVTKSAIRINPDGTYVWNSAWDGKVIQGRWKQEGGAIIVLGGQSGLNWRMERMARPAGDAVVTLWDQNSIWYNGTPLDGK